MKKRDSYPKTINKKEGGVVSRDESLHELIKNDVLFSEMDVDGMTDREIEKVLTDAIDRELFVKDRETDIDRVAFLSELNMRLATDLPAKEELAYELSIVKEKIADTDRSEANMPIVKHNEKRKAFALRAVCVASVLIFALCLTLGVVAKETGYVNAVALIMQKRPDPGGTKDVGKTPTGDDPLCDSVSMVKKGVNTTYNSVEELVKEEKLSILYPRDLPDGVSFTAFFSVPLGGGGENIIASFSGDKNIRYKVCPSGENSQWQKPSDCETVHSNGIDYYINSQADDLCKAEFRSGNNEYLVTADDRSTLMKIIEGIR